MDRIKPLIEQFYTMMPSRKVKKYLIIAVMIATSFLICYPSVTFLYRDSPVQHETEAKRDDFHHELIIISTTYYNESSYYPDNTAVVLLNTRTFLPPNVTWKCYSKNDTGASQEEIVSPVHAFKIMGDCQMQTYLVNCSTVSNSTFVALMPPDVKPIIDGRNPNYINLHPPESSAPQHVPSMVSFPMRTPIREQYPVVSCLSPLFLNERWQLNALSIELLSHFGVSKQVYYVMSILQNGFKLLKEYENLGLIDIRPWIVPNVVFKNGNIPLRTNVEYRNQAAAHQDCYLLYRESAQFIITHDPDDILFPTVKTNLYSEFVYQAQQYPEASSFVYKRLPAQMSSSKPISVADFKTKVPQLLNNIQLLSNETAEKFDKSVHLTSRVESTWIHFAFLHRPNYPTQNISDGYFVHVRDWEPTGKDSFSAFKEKKLATKKLSKVIKNRFSTFSKSGLLSMLKPMTAYYYDTIDSCYTYLKKSRPQRWICPTHYRCQIPKIDNVVCVQAVDPLPLEEQVVDPTRMTLYMSRSDPVFQTSYQGCSVD